MEKYGIIYLITNKINGMQYIGQTKQPMGRRWATHKNDAIRGKNDRPLCKDMREFGIDNFEIIHICSCFDLQGMNLIEIMLIEKFNTRYPDGYNLAAGGFCYAHHESTKQKISQLSSRPEMVAKVKKANSRPVVDQNGTGYPSIKAAANAIGADSTSVSANVYGRTKDCFGFSFSFASPLTERQIQNNAQQKGKVISEETKLKLSKALKGRAPAPQTVKAATEAKMKPIVDHNGVVYSSVKEASNMLGIDHSKISAVLVGKRKTAQGYAFSFDLGNPPNLKEILNKKFRHNKPIIDSDGVIYSSIKEAALKNGVSNTSISSVLRGLKWTSAGKVFSYDLNKTPSLKETLQKKEESLKSKERFEQVSKSHSKAIIDQNGAIYLSIKEAQQILGVQNISKVLLGRQKTTGSFTFSYYTPPESQENSQD